MAGSFIYTDLGSNVSSLERPLLVLHIHHRLLLCFLPFYGTSHYLLFVPPSSLEEKTNVQRASLFINMSICPLEVLKME